MSDVLASAEGFAIAQVARFEAFAVLSTKARPLERWSTMRLIVREIQPPSDHGDHREFEDFRDSIFEDFLGDEFTGFWDKVAPPPSAPKPPADAEQPKKTSWVEVLSLLCVT